MKKREMTGTEKGKQKGSILKKILPDGILLLSLFFVAVILLMAFHLTKEEGSYVVAEEDGREVLRVPLEKDGTYSLCQGKNRLVVKNGEAYMEEANCPDQICVKTGGISYVGETIVCLPHKLSVKITGEDPMVDAVT